MTEVLSCGKCVLQHYLACGKPQHFHAHRVAVKHYLGQEVTEVYAGFKGATPYDARSAAAYQAPAEATPFEPNVREAELVAATD